MKIKPLIVIAASMLALPGAAFAQTSPAVRDCTPTQAKPDDPTGLNTTGRTDRPLTEKLAESGGVLCPPPSTDPEIRVPPPSTGSNMPVVPPPGNSGGDLKPK